LYTSNLLPTKPFIANSIRTKNGSRRGRYRETSNKGSNEFENKSPMDRVEFLSP
jgi:hypothetical protein